MISRTLFLTILVCAGASHAAQAQAITNGWYAGVHAGAFGGAMPFQSYDFVDGSGSHFEGLNLGYDRGVWSHVALGVAADASFAAEPTNGVPVAGAWPKVFGTVRTRLGYTTRGWLAYGTGGCSWARDQLDTTHPGWTVGSGIERRISAHWRINGEYLYASPLDIHQVRIGANYAFAATERDDATPGVAPLDLSGWSLHGQMTYVSQYAAPFRAPYRGPNSLDSNIGRETWDVTVYVGRQLWNGAVVWINPEVDQGYGLSNTLGVAGFTSGEAYKVGYTHPYARVPRAFLQQTIALGEVTEMVEAAPNQVATVRSPNRLVITAGKFSVSDLFDTISYAHDPRGDFMNWALVDAGTFDYAADAWGFTYGAALEWYQSAWTARAGFFDLSNVPNSVDLNSTFSEYQLVYELEHRHAINSRTGKVALVGFVTRGRMGSFDDAVALSEKTGEPADIAAVRRYNTRPGVNLNVEQQLAEDFGAFGRLGWSDGNLEPYEFADIDRTASAGVQMGGARWGHRADTFAVAAVINDISSSHRAFLNAGGLGILVGDGQLPHPGTERILETYYRLALRTWQITADYQFIVNPAYNRDRGPVSALAVRLHTQF